MKSTVMKLIFSALFWFVMFLSSGKLKELFKKEKIEALTADYIEFKSEDGKQYLKFTIKNDTSSEVCYNTEGYLSAKTADECIPIEMKTDHIYSGASFYIAPGDMMDYKICLTDYYEPLVPGEYRYNKTVGCLAVDVDFTVPEPVKKKNR